MASPVEQFREAIRSAGLIPPERIEMGRIHRFPGQGKRDSNKAAWCKLFEDGLGGAFGDFSSGIEESWQAKRECPMTPAESAAIKRQMEESRRQAEAARSAESERKANLAKKFFDGAKPFLQHPYAVEKGVLAAAGNVRVEFAEHLKDENGNPMTDRHGLCLLIPAWRDKRIVALQVIDAAGQKRFIGAIGGAVHVFGKVAGAPRIVVCEGWATGASIHMATGLPVVCCFSAGALPSISERIRANLPDTQIVFGADDDYATETNPGLTKATQAARAVGGLLAIPDFGPNRQHSATDFNDMAHLFGSEAVKRAIEAAQPPEVVTTLTNADDGSTAPSCAADWPEPQPLTAKVEPEPYPIDALPAPIRAAVEEVAGFVKAPIPMVASSALAALSLAAQAHADVKRAERLVGPVGLFLLTIADSGERKSTCDGFFARAIREYEEAQAQEAKPALKSYRAAIEAWEAKRGGIKDKIRQHVKSSKPTADMESALCNLEHDKPEPPRIPRLLYADATPEALAYGLAQQWPAGGVVSAEAGIVFGSHGMGKDSVMRNLGLLNQLWDGTALTVDRRSTESFTVHGARLTVALQVQEPTLREFFSRSGALARGTGFLARFLVAWPESTQGQRPFTEAPANWPALAGFNRRIAAILSQPAPLADGGGLAPPALPLTPEAKAAWIAYHDAIESELASGGELYDVRDVASKSADNAARLAALFQLFDGAGGAIGAEAFDGASRIAAWHLHEARRFFGELALPEELADAARLDSWLISHCKREQTCSVKKNHVRQHGPIRDGSRLDVALRELSALDRVRLAGERPQMIQVNPGLMR